MNAERLSAADSVCATNNLRAQRRGHIVVQQNVGCRLQIYTGRVLKMIEKNHLHIARLERLNLLCPCRSRALDFAKFYFERDQNLLQLSAVARVSVAVLRRKNKFCVWTFSQSCF